MFRKIYFLEIPCKYDSGNWKNKKTYENPTASEKEREREREWSVWKREWLISVMNTRLSDVIWNVTKSRRTYSWKKFSVLESSRISFIFEYNTFDKVNLWETGFKAVFLNQCVVKVRPSEPSKLLTTYLL